MIRNCERRIACQIVGEVGDVSKRKPSNSAEIRQSPIARTGPNLQEELNWQNRGYREMPEIAGRVESAGQSEIRIGIVLGQHAHAIDTRTNRSREKESAIRHECHRIVLTFA